MQQAPRRSAGLVANSVRHSLFVVKRDDFDLFAAGIFSMRRDRAALSVSREGDLPGLYGIATFLNGYVVGVPVHLFEGPSILGRITSDRIILAIELSRPLSVSGVAFAIDAVDGAFYAIACSHINDCKIFRRSRGYFRFRFIQLPGTQIRILGETYRKTCKQYRQRQCNTAQFHSFSRVSLNRAPV